MDCLRIFKFLISSSMTPIGWNTRGGYKYNKFPIKKLKSPVNNNF